MAAPYGDTAEAAFGFRLPLAPYPGLRPFETFEWPIFFGQETMTDQVIGQLLKQHLVVVHGDSGCSKSSLIRAGVLSRLTQEQERSDVSWRTGVMLPRDRPVQHLATEIGMLDGALGDSQRYRQIRRVLNLGRDAPGALAQLLRRGDNDHICILIDQFEELFRFARYDRDQAELFVDILVGLEENPAPGLYVILTMRSEFLGACARFKGLAESVNRTQTLLPQMERPALMRAIREPATLYQSEVSRELAELLIADAGGGQDQLPLIQHSLALLWRRTVETVAGRNGFEAQDAIPSYRHGTGAVWRLGLEDYKGPGGLANLLSDHADEVMAVAAPDAKREKIVEHLFRALTDINAEGSAVRRPQSFAQLKAVTGSDEQTLRDIIDRFRADGVWFLTPNGDGPLAPDTLIDISHEALIRCWRKIANAEDGWLQREFRDGLIWQSLRLQADKFSNNEEQILSAAETTYSDRWLNTLPSPAWTDRYRGGWHDVQRLMQASRDARAREIRKDLWVRRGLIAAAAIYLLLTAFAGWSWWQAQRAQSELEIGSPEARAEQAQKGLDNFK